MTLAYHPTDHRLAAGGTYDFVELWNVVNPNAHILSAHDGTIHSVRFSPDGSLIASGGADDVIYLTASETYVRQASLRAIQPM